MLSLVLVLDTWPGCLAAAGAVPFFGLNLHAQQHHQLINNACLEEL
jgi:hypothetical protein